MKGMVFTEFLEMVEDKFSSEVADWIIEQANLRSGGVYTSVGTYDHGEMIELVSCLSKKTGIPSADLVKSFGFYLFDRFHNMYPIYFKGVASSFDFLQRIEDYIHVEVRKLYAWPSVSEADVGAVVVEAPVAAARAGRSARRAGPARRTWRGPRAGRSGGRRQARAPAPVPTSRARRPRTLPAPARGPAAPAPAGPSP